MAGYTKGPWQRSGTRQTSPIYKGHMVGPDGDGVVIVPYDDKQHSECLANANLIAAAPDMYEALKVLLACPDIADIHAEDKDPETDAAERLARSAIEKAEGNG